jgi:hypothetical protein
VIRLLSVIRKRLCYANVVATLALVFAMSGGALAAGHYLLTSTSQVSPKVLKALKGKKGAAGPVGAAGAQGPKGEAGANGGPGAPGAKGEPGPKGETGAPGTPGTAGKEGSPWTAGGTLPAGKSETGAWEGSGGPGIEGVDSARVVLASFAIPLPAPPTIYVVGVEEGQGEAKENEKPKKRNEERKEKGEAEIPLTIPADCNGNAAKPEATNGDLCVFVQSDQNVNLFPLGLPINKLITTAGVVTNLDVFDFEEGFYLAGTWAVTAS